MGLLNPDTTNSSSLRVVWSTAIGVLHLSITNGYRYGVISQLYQWVHRPLGGKVNKCITLPSGFVDMIEDQLERSNLRPRITALSKKWDTGNPRLLEVIHMDPPHILGSDPCRFFCLLVAPTKSTLPTLVQ